MINATDPRIVRIAWDQRIDRDNPKLVPVFRKAATYMGKFSKAPFKIELVGPKWGDGESGNVDWYLEKSKQGDRYRSETLLELLRAEQGRVKPHYDILVISGELTLDGTCVLGASDGFTSAVQSVSHILRNAKSSRTARLIISASIAHEVGHVMGLLPETASNHDPRSKSGEENAWIYQDHCAHPFCLMRQTLSINDVEERLGVFGRLKLCFDCQQVLAPAV